MGALRGVWGCPEPQDRGRWEEAKGNCEPGEDRRRGGAEAEPTLRCPVRGGQELYPASLIKFLAAQGWVCVLGGARCQGRAAAALCCHLPATATAGIGDMSPTSSSKLGGWRCRLETGIRGLEGLGKGRGGIEEPLRRQRKETAAAKDKKIQFYSGVQGIQSQTGAFWHKEGLLQLAAAAQIPATGTAAPRDSSESPCLGPSILNKPIRQTVHVAPAALWGRGLRQKRLVGTLVLSSAPLRDIQAGRGAGGCCFLRYLG